MSVQQSYYRNKSSLSSVQGNILQRLFKVYPCPVSTEMNLYGYVLVRRSGWAQGQQTLNVNCLFKILSFFFLPFRSISPYILSSQIIAHSAGAAGFPALVAVTLHGGLIYFTVPPFPDGIIHSFALYRESAIIIIHITMYKHEWRELLFYQHNWRLILLYVLDPASRCGPHFGNQTAEWTVISAASCNTSFKEAGIKAGSPS